jgi:hypothetical protein
MSKLTAPYDANLILKDAGLVAASAAATVSSAAKIIDLGSGNVEADVIIDVSACEVASEDESYRIAVQLSDSATFANDVYEVENIQLGACESDFFVYVNRISGYTLTLDTAVDGAATPTAGYQAISNATGTLGTITGATVPALPSRTYNIDISIDSTNYPLAVALLVTDTWTQIAAKLQAALRTATSSTETIAISGGKIVVTSATTGTSSKVAIAAGSTKATTTIFGDTDMTTGRYVINFKNCVAEGVIKRYMRLYTHVAGTIATGINYKAYLSMNI